MFCTDRHGGLSLRLMETGWGNGLRTAWWSGPAFAQTDYDMDDDNLIDVTTLPQLNAIRYDLNGDGVVADNETVSQDMLSL